MRNYAVSLTIYDYLKAESMSLEYHFCEHSEVLDSYFESCASRALPTDSNDAKREDSLLCYIQSVFVSRIHWSFGAD